MLRCDADAAAVVHQNFRAAALGNLALSALVAVALWEHVDPERILGWVAALWLMVAFRWAIDRRYPGPVADEARTAAWSHWSLVGVAASGTAWGSAAILFLTPGVEDLICLPLGGVTAGSVMTGAVFLPAVYAFTIPALLPLTVMLLATSGAMGEPIGFMVAVYAILLFFIAHHLNRYFRDTLRLKGENAALEKKLSRARYETELAEEFLSNLSHELRTPLNAISGFAQLQVQQIFGPLGDRRYAGYARDIRDSAEHLLALIADIEDMSRIESGNLVLELAPVDVTDLALRAIGIAFGRAGDDKPNCVTDVEDNLPLLMADRRRLTQIIVHLLSNASKFTPAAGTVTVRIGREANGDLALTVEDTGCGIAPEDIPTAMRPFGQVGRGQKAPHAGLGLGLNLVTKLAELQEARFEIKSHVGVGTRAVIWFPASRLVTSEDGEAAPGEKGSARLAIAG
ncbi:MAG: HAMP domain-containing sensor histidine kinase [Alphaproteobacteria bacterium]